MKQQPAKSGVAAWVAWYAAMATLAAVFFGLWAGFTDHNLVIERAAARAYRNKSADEIHSLQKSLQAANDIAVAARADLDSFREKQKLFNAVYRRWFDEWDEWNCRHGGNPAPPPVEYDALTLPVPK